MERIKEVLSSPWLILLSLGLGVVIGKYFAGAVDYIKIIGDVYIGLMQMCATIILPALVITSIGRLVTESKDLSLIVRIFLTFVASLLIASFLGISLALITKPVTAPDFETKKAIGDFMMNSAAAGDATEDSGAANDTGGKSKEEKGGGNLFVRNLDHKVGLNASNNTWLGKFVLGSIPENIFEALTNGKTIPIVFFSIVLGFMMQFAPPRSAKMLFDVLDGLSDSFSNLIEYILYFLPFALFSIIASQVKGLDFSIFASLIKVVILLLSSLIGSIIVSSIIVWRKSGKSYMYQFKALKDGLVIAFMARDSFIAMPALIQGLSDHLEFDKNKTETAAPLWVIDELHSTVVFFAAISVFAVQLYDQSLTVSTLLLIAVGSIFAALSAMSLPSPACFMMLAIGLSPLGIPVQAFVVILMLCEPIVEPFVCLSSAYICAACTALVAGKADIVRESQEVENV